jgi:hypothetical protein
MQNVNFLFVSNVYKFPKKGTVGSRNHLYFLFLEISNPNFTLLSKSEIFNSRNTLALAQIRKIIFPKWNYKILL